MAKILLSAIACEPYGLSEGAVGWNALKCIAKHHECFVVTHAINRSQWEKAYAEKIIPDGVEVTYLGKDEPWHNNRLIARAQSWKRYIDFSNESLELCQRLHAEKNFDLCHQVVYATWRIPSPLWKLPIPFVWGPVGGAAYIPKAFQSMLGLSAKATEAARSLQTSLAVKSRKFRDCIENSTVVMAANEETENFLKTYREDLPMLRLPVAYLSPEKVVKFRRPATDHIPSQEEPPLKLFAGGNIEGRKGVSIAIKALALAKERGLVFHYTVAGGGPEIEKLTALRDSLNLQGEITFHPGFSGADFISKLHESDIYFLPSFRETTPVTLQEAVLAGCYPIVADASAAGEMVRIVGGQAIKAETPEQLAKDLANAILKVASDRDDMRQKAGSFSKVMADAYSAERYEQITMEAYRIALA